MAKSYAYYEWTDLVDGDRESLCFPCAVRKAAEGELKIKLQTTDYPHTECYVCGQFIDDTVEV